MRTKLNRLQYFLIISLMVHLILAFAVTDPSLRHLLRLIHLPPVAPPPPPSLTLKLLPSNFVPTLPSQAAPQADPNATLESERNTLLRSPQPGQQPSSLPNMTGHRGGLVYHDSPNSPQVQSQESEAAPKAAAQVPAPHPPAATQAAAQSPDSASGAKPAPAIPSDPDAVPVLPPPPDSKNRAEKQDEAAPPQPQSQPAQVSPPPSSASFSQQRSEAVGGPAALGQPSPSAKESEVGRYKSKLYRMIGSKWYISVEKNMTLLAIGEVHVKFFVQSNGVISQVSVSSESGRVDILQNISLKAVSESYGEPFTDSLKQQFGDGYWDDITFTIY